MTSAMQRWTAQGLEELKDQLIDQVAAELASILPPLGVSPEAMNRQHQHHQQMISVVERFHDMLQAGSTLDWNLLKLEYEWTKRVLGPRGITWDHQQTLLATYFATARRLRSWTDDEQQALAEMEEQVHEQGRLVYSVPN